MLYTSWQPYMTVKIFYFFMIKFHKKSLSASYLTVSYVLDRDETHHGYLYYCGKNVLKMFKKCWYRYWNDFTNFHIEIHIKISSTVHFLFKRKLKMFVCCVWRLLPTLVVFQSAIIKNGFSNNLNLKCCHVLSW